MAELGKTGHLSVFAVRTQKQDDGNRPPICEDLATLIEQMVIQRIGMHCEGLFSATWRFQGSCKSGFGFIHVQPISESLLAWDTWSEHQGGYFIVFSCERYEPQDVADILLDYFEIVDRGFMTLRLAA
jgi:hypothetical protein